MKAILLVALGGAIGAVSRYTLGGWILHHASDWKFPLSTFVVNVSGCLIAGILTGVQIRREIFGPEMMLFLFTGILGGYTTFSAFGLETAYLLRRGEVLLASTNVIASAAVGVTALWLGMKLAQSYYSPMTSRILSGFFKAPVVEFLLAQSILWQ